MPTQRAGCPLVSKKPPNEAVVPAVALALLVPSAGRSTGCLGGSPIVQQPEYVRQLGFVQQSEYTQQLNGPALFVRARVPYVAGTYIRCPEHACGRGVGCFMLAHPEFRMVQVQGGAL